MPENDTWNFDNVESAELWWEAVTVAGLAAVPWAAIDIFKRNFSGGINAAPGDIVIVDNPPPASGDSTADNASNTPTTNTTNDLARQNSFPGVVPDSECHDNMILED
mmetsp:Transcript_21091/g.35977  ORF Transcript_21091/g.35977 Transcript_21091/m.35977 type:complete len:107 (-) Transcript_21091:542-862(-)